MKRDVKIALIIALAIGLLSIPYDFQLSQFAASLRGFIPDVFFIGFAFEMQTFIVLFFLTSLFLFQEHKRKWIIPLWATALATIAISYIFKVMIMRARPFEVGYVNVLPIAYAMLENGFSIWNSSFPSFQAMLAFSALPILDKEFRRFKWAWFVIACLIAFSRVYFGVHYASDVIIGGAIGYFIGYFFVKLEEEYLFGERASRKANNIFRKLYKSLKFALKE